MRAVMKRLLGLFLVLGLGVALAEPVSVRLELPNGLMAGKVPVSAAVSGIEGAKVSVAVDPGNGLATREVTLDSGKGELELEGVSPAALVTVKVEQGGKNYAETQAYRDQRALEFVMSEPRSRASLQYPLLLWAGLIVVLGLIALRGKTSVF